MKNQEQIKKIESVVLYVLQKFPQGVDYIKLFKIIYFAQRDYLAKYGKVLCPDTFKARTYGPIPALSDKVIKLVEFDDEYDIYPDLRDFCKSIKVENQMAFAINEPDMDFISKKECECLDRWFEYCKDRDSVSELSPESHDEAYDKAFKRCQEDPQLAILTNIEIAKAGGATEEMIDYIRTKELLASELS